MLQIAICDDDTLMRAYLSALCEKTLSDINIHAYDDGNKLLCSETSFDIILMDIKLGEQDGLQAIAQLRERAEPDAPQHPAVIFITAYDEHVFEALDLFPFHYLLKPLDEEKFKRVLTLAAQSSRKAHPQESLFFHTKSSHIRLFLSEIYYVESNLRKVIIHTSGEAIEIYATMDSLEEKLGDCFFRCHRGFLVNLEQISGYDRQTVRLRDGSKLLMSKPKYTAFVDAYMRFLHREKEG